MVLLGERKACAVIVLAFFGVLFAMNGLLGPSPLAPMFLALAACYVTALFGLVAGYFWARWFAMGLANSGLMMGAIMAWQMGLEPFVLFWCGTHAVVALALLGRGPVSLFEGRADWRERFNMDQTAVERLGKTVKRAGASLPYLIMAGLAPKQGMDGVFALLALGVGAAGIWGIIRMRAWGLLALGGASGLILASADYGSWQATSTTQAAMQGAGILAAFLMLAAVLPFVRPMLRFVRGSTSSS